MRFERFTQAVENGETTLIELEVAWSQLSASEVQELKNGKVEFCIHTEYSPLHCAAGAGKKIAMEFLLVSITGEIFRLKYQTELIIKFFFRRFVGL